MNKKGYWKIYENNLYVTMFILRSQNPLEIGKESSAFFQTHGDELVLKEKNRYWYQVQGQMGVTGLKQTDVVVWTFK